MKNKQLETKNNKDETISVPSGIERLRRLLVKKLYKALKQFLFLQFKVYLKVVLKAFEAFLLKKKNTMPLHAASNSNGLSLQQENNTNSILRGCSAIKAGVA